MGFHFIDFDHWDRKEYYNHFTNDVICSYSMTTNMDITGLSGQALYPAMLWLLTDTVNEMEEFRTFCSPDGLGIFDDMHPSYTIFHKEIHTFSAIWTAFDENYGNFLNAYHEDVQMYSKSTQLAPKKDRPANTFDVSMIPWTTFSSFHLNVQNSGNYLLPIFTMGKSFAEGTATMLPLAIQVHHAVCDGYHVGRFVDTLQEKINSFCK